MCATADFCFLLLFDSHSSFGLADVQHYLVAEYLMTAPVTMTPEIFYAMTKQEQAELIWKALFIDRIPLSEATRGVGKSSCAKIDASSRYCEDHQSMLNVFHPLTSSLFQ
jgi:hypothetical protein